MGAPQPNFLPTIPGCSEAAALALSNGIMGQMSNQWEREGHAKRLAATERWPHGGLNLHCNSSKEAARLRCVCVCEFVCMCAAGTELDQVGQEL